MPGNSQRHNRRKPGTKKGAVVGSGGKHRTKGKGPTPPAELRPGHPAARRAAAATRKVSGKQGRPKVAPGRKDSGSRSGGRAGRNAKHKAGGRESAELLVGRNPVVEALRADIPATALYVALGIDIDERINEAVRGAANRGLAILDISRAELDRLTGGVLHQGIALKVPPYQYASLNDVLGDSGPGLLIALDGVTDPRNLGAIVRSAAAFGARGVIIPERRAAGMTATAWRTSAGAAARLPVVRITNLVRALKTCQDHGYSVVGLDADGPTTMDDLPLAIDPIVVVVGSEGRGLSRLVGTTCDLRIAIPMAGQIESLNASVAAAVVLAEITRRRRVDS